MNIREVKVVRAGELARLFCKPEASSEANLIFGKIFEDEYTYSYYWYMEKTSGIRWVDRLFYRKIAWRLKAEGIYTKELMVKAIKLHATLFHHKIYGYKPRTKFRRLGDIVISAQPDIELAEKMEAKLCEFKTYPIDDYARIQAKVFSFVWEQPILLVGCVEENNYYSIQKELVTNDINWEDVIIPEELGAVQAFCLDCMNPAGKCQCPDEEENTYERFYPDYYEEEEYEEDEEEEDEEEEDLFLW